MDGLGEHDPVPSGASYLYPDGATMARGWGKTANVRAAQKTLELRHKGPPASATIGNLIVSFLLSIVNLVWSLAFIWRLGSKNGGLHDATDE